MNRQPFDFEKLDVYRCAVEFLAISVRIITRVPRGNSDLRDQLRRASTSIVLNIAEASGKTTTTDRSHYYAVARGSALECAAILDVLVLLGGAAADVVDNAKILLSRIVSMLTKMCR